MPMKGSDDRLEKLHEKMYSLHLSPNIIRTNQEENVGLDMQHAWRNAYNILIVKPESNRLFGGPSCKWKDNIEEMIKCMM